MLTCITERAFVTTVSNTAKKIQAKQTAHQAKTAHSTEDQKLKLSTRKFQIKGRILEGLRTNHRINLNGFDFRGLHLKELLQEARNEALADGYINEDLSFSWILRGSDLSEANLFGQDLSDLNLEYTNLRKANLQNTQMLRTNLKQSNLLKANYKGAYVSNVKTDECTNVIDAIGDVQIKPLYLSDVRLELADAQDRKRKDPKAKGPNFSNKRFVDNIVFPEDMDLCGADFAGATMRNPHFACPLENVSFEKAKLTKVTFHKKLQDVNFNGSQLYQAKFTDQIDKSNFNNAYLYRPNLSVPEIQDSAFINTELVKPNFFCSKIKKADFENAKIIKGSFENATIDNSLFRNTRLYNSNFTASTIDSSNFNDAKLRKSNFSKAEIKQSDFQKADCSNANFSKSIISGHTEQTFDKTKLANANFRGAKLSNLILAEPADSEEEILKKFENASFDTCEFDQCDLSNLDLSSCSFLGTRLIAPVLANTNFKGCDFRFAEILTQKPKSLESANFSNIKAYKAQGFDSLKERYNINFKDRDFENKNLAGAIINFNLINENFKGANFSNTIFKPPNNSRVVLTGSDFSRANFRHSDMCRTNIKASNFTDANLSCAALSQDENYHSCLDEHTNFTNAKLRGANLSALDLRKPIMVGAKLETATLNKATLSGLDFSNKSLIGTRFDGALVEGTNFKNADLRLANLCWQGTPADLKGAKTWGALLDPEISYGFEVNDDDNNDLNNLDLSYCDFTCARFGKVQLRNTNLQYCNFYNADFNETDLRNANLNNARLGKYTNFSTALIDSTILGFGEEFDDQEIDWSNCDLHPRIRAILDSGDPDIEKLYLEDPRYLRQDSSTDLAARLRVMHWQNKLNAAQIRITVKIRSDETII